MKINGLQNIQKVLGAYNKNVSKVNKSTGFTQEEDKIDISDKAREYQVATGAYKKLPDIRKDKVDDIKRKIESGNYRPSMEEVVDKMMGKK
ncbi:flagellar biosynthesis anti-sigma factor FlgM [Lutibacter sp. B2]|nr:flagellar biosynthesis anti-sigma factor FlgM [Lutibacter sp. B2]